MTRPSTETARLRWAILYLFIAIITLCFAVYYYWTDEMLKAIFWLVFSVGCEVSIIRRNTE